MKKLLVVLIIGVGYSQYRDIPDVVTKVGVAGAIFSIVHPNGYNNAIGGTGVSSPSNYIPFYNPASPLMNRGLNIEFSEGFCYWLPNLADDIEIKNNLTTISYGTSQLSDNYFMQFSISISSFDLTNSGSEIFEYFNNFNMYSNGITYSIGMKSQQYPILFSVGMTNKNLTQQIFYSNDYSYSTNKVLDWGFLLSIENEFRNAYNIISTIGYSKSNISDEFVSYYNISETRPDPLPRNARVGISFVLEKTLHDEKKMSANILMEAENILIDRGIYDDVENSWEYTYSNSYLGGIDLIENIFLGNSNDIDGVVINRGIDINYNDVLNIGFGKIIDKAGRIDVKSWGCKLSLLKLIHFSTLNLKNIDLDWVFANDGGKSGAPRSNTNHHQLKLTIKNLDELINK